MGDTPADRVLNMDALLRELAQWYAEVPLQHRARLAIDPESNLPVVDRDVRPVRAALALIASCCDGIARQDDAVTVECRRLKAGTDCIFRVRPNPSFFVTFKDAHEAVYSQLTPAGIMALGSGLAQFLLAQRVASRHGIKVWLEVDGSMATTHVYVSDDPLGMPSQREKPLILIIEDVIDIGALLSFYLTQAGFQTLRAHDGLQGITLAKEHQPDLITLDVMMPQMDGWEVLTELKANPSTRPIPVVLISVLKDKQIGFERGAADYLPKPVVRTDLIAAVQRLLSTPGIPGPLLLDHPRHPVMFAVQPDAGAIAQTFGDSVTAIDLLSPDALSTVFERETAPDLLVVDFSASYEEGLTAAIRLRLFPSFDTVPLVAICPGACIELLRFQSHGIIDAIVTADAATIPGIIASLR